MTTATFSAATTTTTTVIEHTTVAHSDIVSGRDLEPGPLRWKGPASLPPALSRRRELAQDRENAGRSEADRESTRLNSSHTVISYAVLFLVKQHINSPDQVNDS